MDAVRPVRVCILGGTGFVGARLATRLLRRGHRVTVLSRDRERHKDLLVLPGLALENCDVHDEAALAERFRGQEVVVNLVGILNERGFGGRGFRRAHTELTRVALEAARSAGVRRFLQMSALGATEGAPSHYLRTKGAAERLVREQSGAMDWTIYRPSVIFGLGDSFLNRFAALLATVPLALPLAMPG
ncbi:MAG TPA: NAD(P)H-binding protein, partial [Steroidobacteraceae bacterium]|nr:NAD(P)H-binding protein [Steroidobacteraceae bacterium]